MNADQRRLNYFSLISVYLRLSAVLFLTACAGAPRAQEEAPLVLKAASFSDLPGWGGDDLSAAVPALQKTCDRLAAKDAAAPIGTVNEAGTYGDWQSVCTDLAAQTVTGAASLKTFFETHFRPYAAYAGNAQDGLFTGYYEASLRGSKTRHDQYQVPLYARPEDLVMVNLGEFRDALKGQRIAGRVVDGNLRPYEDRAHIVAGQWPHNDKVLVWVDNPVDAFFVQVQGSGVVQMDDGSIVRIGYDGQNGHIYYAIGRELVKRGDLSKDNVSMQAIRGWLANNPQEAVDVMNTNPSYVFFRVLDNSGPVGGEGVALTPGRSMAIDHAKLPYGIPLWVDIAPPVDGTGRINRLMMAQDTGGAIRGAVRGDVFWGFGSQAESMAGPMKSQGRYWLLLPKSAEKTS